VVDIPDVVKYTNFGDHRLRGFWVAEGQISPSPIDFHRRPYNTLAVPCERVMWTEITFHKLCYRELLGIKIISEANLTPRRVLIGYLISALDFLSYFYCEIFTARL